MAEYVLSKVVGNGQFPGRGEALTDANGPYRRVVERYATTYVHAIDGTRCLSLVVDPDLTAINADPRCRVIPGATLDEVFGVVAANVVNNWLATNGYTTRVTAGQTKRDLVNAVGTEINPGFGLFAVGGVKFEPHPDG